MPKSTKPESQAKESKRFIEAAREAGCSEDEVDVDRELKAVAKPKEAPKAGRRAK